MMANTRWLLVVVSMAAAMCAWPAMAGRLGASRAADVATQSFLQRRVLQSDCLTCSALSNCVRAVCLYSDGNATNVSSGRSSGLLHGAMICLSVFLRIKFNLHLSGISGSRALESGGGPSGVSKRCAGRRPCVACCCATSHCCSLHANSKPVSFAVCESGLQRLQEQLSELVSCLHNTLACIAARPPAL